MKKPQRLRQLLHQRIPLFDNDPDRLHIFYANGTISATGAHSLSFEYSYDLEITIEDVAFPIDVLFLAILEFVEVEQSELLFNPSKQKSIAFEVDPNNHETYDISIKIPLTERVIITTSERGYSITHAKEPQFKDFVTQEQIIIEDGKPVPPRSYRPLYEPAE